MGRRLLLSTSDRIRSGWSPTKGLTRSPTPIFNEKVLAGLGREVQSTGLLAADAVEKALVALERFRTLCDTMRVRRCG